MNTPQNAQRKRKALFILACIAILFGGSLLYAGTDNPVLRVLGLVFLMGAVVLIRVANAQNRTIPSTAFGQANSGNSPSVMRRALWIVSLSLVPAIFVARLLLQLDSEHGGHEVWPVYLFAGVGLVCAVVWSLLVASIFSGRSRPI